MFVCSSIVSCVPRWAAPERTAKREMTRILITVNMMVMNTMVVLWYSEGDKHV